MKRAVRFSLAVALCALPTALVAQQPPPAQAPSAPAPNAPAPGQSAAPQDPPKGPADIIGRSGRARAARELEQAGTRGASQQQSAPAPDPNAAAEPPSAPAQDPPAASAATRDPHAAAQNQNPHPGTATGDSPPPVASERVDTGLPAGTIRVRVRDPDGSLARDAEVSVGIMLADGTRESKDARTDAVGIATFSGLTTGERQAYRVNVPYQGAKYSSNPFRLPPRGGYDVEIRRLETTRDPKLIVLYVGATSVELKDDRIHVVQQSRLLNLTDKAYVFPEEGALVRLPDGFKAVQVQETMTDQRVVESEEGLRVRGSILPGEVTLLWGFDLPLSGTEARFAIDLPWLTFAYRVIADAPEGLSLSVEDMPAPILHADAGRRFLITEVQRKIGDPPFQRLDIALDGIPGPGPGRFIASALALALVIGGVALARRPAPAHTAVSAGTDFEARKQALLDSARQLDALRAAGEIGPQYHEEQMSSIADELAALLFDHAESQSAQAPAQDAAQRAPASSPA